MLNPIIDHTIADAKVRGDLLDGQLLGPAEHGRRNPVALTNPSNHFRRVRLTRGAHVSVLVELLGDLLVE